ncbi:hypothetical protein E3O32_16530 [Cryobacterium mannosilyticum]|uniref:Uncharacterized protein n=1 Tax=Cryobacterium mannosilyticum TaxID=1259190 RepID=A0A4R8VZX3_9MICO|nr:hypothetical protein E3O32_16530 [Cryobacterium mannosilyticum]
MVEPVETPRAVVSTSSTPAGRAPPVVELVETPPTSPRAVLSTGSTTGWRGGSVHLHRLNSKVGFQGVCEWSTWSFSGNRTMWPRCTRGWTRCSVRPSSS